MTALFQARAGFAILLGTFLAAAGQVFLKLGATGRTSLGDFVNGWSAAGLLCYAVGTALWIYALSRVRLTLVYPFSALTFVLVYSAGVLFLGEPLSRQAIIGIVLILGGLYLVASSA